MMDISIIIPIYKGSSYISYWIDKIKNNVELLNDTIEVNCELIFVNDSPDEYLEIEDIDYEFSLKIINNAKNLGIHASRVAGIKNALGNYIVMIDQDDKISDTYLLSQYRKIGTHDAVVCNGTISRPCLNVKSCIYHENRPINQVTSYKVFIEKENYIISPGQVMIRKSLIPKEWLENIMNQNGIDDYLLWILMHHNRCVFTVNEELLYEHVGHVSNVSNNRIGMYKSCLEMIDILKRKQLIEDEEILQLEKQIKSSVNIELTFAEKQIKKIQLYDMWLFLKNRNIKISEYLYSHNYKRIIVYGLDLIGNRLLDELDAENIEIVAAIDQNAKKMVGDIPIIEKKDKNFKNYINNADAMIVTALFSYESIKEEFEEKYQIPILSIENIIKELVYLSAQ